MSSDHGTGWKRHLVWLLPTCEVLSVAGHETMLISAGSIAGDRRPQAIGASRGTRKRSARWRRVRLALRDEAAYLQTDEDDKPAIIAEPLPDPASIVCSFCGKSAQQVSDIFAGRRPVRDPFTEVRASG